MRRLNGFEIRTFQNKFFKPFLISRYLYLTVGWSKAPIVHTCGQLKTIQQYNFSEDSLLSKINGLNRKRRLGRGLRGYLYF